MISRPLVLGLLAAGCVTAAAGGAYVAVRQNAVDPGLPLSTLGTAPAGEAAETTVRPVEETEAIVQPQVIATSSAPTAPLLERRVEPVREARRVAREPSPAPAGTRRNSAPQVPSVAEPDPVRELPPAATSIPEPVALDIPTTPGPAPAIPEREFVEVVVPASAVIGLQLDTSLSSERARVEDRVEARVTRDVTAEGRIAIPAGSRVIGSVTAVERGGKLKERARLGVRFHTLVLANGLELPIRTETIVREGDSPGNESARKIGGAAAGGAILGAILGGGKGAIIGGATGAAGGTAVVMAGDRNAATLPAGTVLTVRLTGPVAVDVEKR